jgi:hypothetical protein
MPLRFSRNHLLVIAVLLSILVVFVFSTRQPRVDYISQVKPLLNKNCITCHGGVKRKAGFSLLFRSEALAINESGKAAIIPGDPGNSEMIRRITHNDPEERMPYKHPALSKDEISLLKRWIAEGAEWGDHWAYVPVQPVPLPEVGTSLFGLIQNEENKWIKHDIDRFILQELNNQDLQPSGETDKETLLRRVSLDLTGLPPSQVIRDRYLMDTSTNAYSNLVDQLLSTPAYGEKWAAMWMDLARYSDTKGYERDDVRSIWRYRDYLIRAFNDDKPYNQFLTEQIAGDLLPGASDEQLIATAFHRNTMTNDEGGTDNEEFRTAAVLDRVNTTWEALMGTSFACVQCHSHPYDPFRHEEYYQFMAFFNNSRDEDTWSDYPVLRHFEKNDSGKLQSLNRWISQNISQHKAKEITSFIKTWQPAINSLRADNFINSELADTKWLVLRNRASTRLPQVPLNNSDVVMFRFNSYKKNGTMTIRAGSIDGPVLLKIKLPQTKDWEIRQYPVKTTPGVHDLYFSYENPELKNPDDNGVLFDWFYFSEKFPAKKVPGSDSAEKQYWELVRASTQVTPVMMENPADLKRTTNVFERGNWLVKGDAVQPGVPKSLNDFPEDAPENRLGLAKWMTSREHPLTARTMVNRMWEQIFGNGLVETLEDLGTQGAQPTHRELLDWLSRKFMNEYKWSMKRLLKEMVLSATYRQDARVTPEMLDKDPNNRYYARAPRIRLSAEQVRDQALAASGLLSTKMYGPSVMPYQPDGIWLSPWSGGEYWKKSEGDEQYRRSLYTYWKRTAPFPAMLTFDAGMREVCVSRRIRTNTPLQALVTLNDQGFIEMARSLAKKMIASGNGLPQQIAFGYEQLMFKNIPPEKLKVLSELYQHSFQQYKIDAAATCEMTGLMDQHNTPQTAAMVVVANALLNLDEVITKN